MVSLFVDAAPILTPVMFWTGLVVTASSAGLMWMGWKEARETKAADRSRRRAPRRPPRNGPLRAIDAQA